VPSLVPNQCLMFNIHGRDPFLSLRASFTLVGSSEEVTIAIPHRTVPSVYYLGFTMPCWSRKQVDNGGELAGCVPLELDDTTWVAVASARPDLLASAPDPAGGSILGAGVESWSPHADLGAKPHRPPERGARPHLAQKIPCLGNLSVLNPCATTTAAIPMMVPPQVVRRRQASQPRHPCCSPCRDT
jgi:hypothetical protein